MIGPRKLLFAIIFTLAVVGLSSANDVYLAQTAQGGNTGADCADALVYSYFNTSGNWTSGTPSGTKIGPGTTVHLCGTFSDPSGGTASLLKFQGSGTSGSPITLHWETGAVLTSSAWYSQGAVNNNNQTWLVIDGGTNGIIENTLNGTTSAYTGTAASCIGGACSVQQASRFVWIQGCASATCNIEVKNLTMYDPYVHLANSGDTYINQGYAECVYFGGGTPQSNITIDNNVCRNAEAAIDGGQNNIDEHANELYYCDRPIIFGPSTPSSGLLIYANHIHDLYTWDETSTDYYHHDGIQMFANKDTANISGAIIYNNLFDGNAGSCCQTAWLTFEGTFTSPIAFNNVFNHQGGDYQMSDIQSFQNGTGGSPNTVANLANYNNTTLNGSYTVTGDVDIYANGTGTTNEIIINNVLTGGILLVAIGTGSSLASGGVDYNLYESLVGAGTSNDFAYGSAYQNSLAAWQSATGQDAHAQMAAFSAMGLSSTGVPTSSSLAVGAGKNLYSVCNGQPIPGLGALCYDKPQTVGPGYPTLGNARPTSGAWDAGAYSDPSGAQQPNPPTGLSAVVQ